MIGRYLDALPRAARGRLLEARAWTVDGYVDPNGARSLLGHAEDWRWDAKLGASTCGARDLISVREAACDSWLNWPPTIDVRYRHLVARVGFATALGLLRSRASRRRSGGLHPHLMRCL